MLDLPHRPGHRATIDAAIAADKLGFVNVHYAAAGVKFGADAHVGYEYPGNDYAGPLRHASRTQCEGCHAAAVSDHTFRIADAWQPVCQTCHADQSGPEQVRLVHLADYDGDGKVTRSRAAAASLWQAAQSMTPPGAWAWLITPGSEPSAPRRSRKSAGLWQPAYVAGISPSSFQWVKASAEASE